MTTVLSRSLIALPALLLAGAALAAEDKWQVTTKMEMVGMPFQMPAQAQTICVPPGQATSEKMVPAKENCKISGFKTTGNTSRFHVECPPPEKMSGDGEFTVLGPDSYKGSMAIKGVMEGEPVDMKMSWTGKKLGQCDAVKDKAISVTAIQQQQQAQVGQMCAQLADGMGWQTAQHMEPSCPTIKADICKRAKTLFDGPKKSDAVLDMQEKRGDWKELAGYCGIDVVPLTAKYCTMAKKEQNWNNAALICGKDAELEALAKKECTGKMYTAGLVEDKYQSLCARYADMVDPGSAPKSSGSTKSAGGSTGNTTIDTGKKAVEGFKKLKGFLGN